MQERKYLLYFIVCPTIPHGVSILKDFNIAAETFRANPFSRLAATLNIKVRAALIALYCRDCCVCFATGNVDVWYADTASSKEGLAIILRGLTPHPRISLFFRLRINLWCLSSCSNPFTSLRVEYLMVLMQWLTKSHSGAPGLVST